MPLHKLALLKNVQLKCHTQDTSELIQNSLSASKMCMLPAVGKPWIAQTTISFNISRCMTGMRPQTIQNIDETHMRTCR